jgi:hypothetical protein
MSASEATPPVDSTGAADQPKEPPVPDLSGRAEQVGSIIVKTLDLAEAGLSLGITVLSRAGAVAQGALSDRISGDAPAGAQATATYDEAPIVEDSSDGPPPPVATADDEGFFLTNRVPLAPGGEIRVSFSITNDSLLEPKRVQMRVVALVGEQHGASIDDGAVAVRPARKTIQPVDFEKFVLTGTLPAATVPDVYRGSVIVQSTDEMSIPIRLFVAVP